MTIDHHKLLELESRIDILLMDIAAGLPKSAYQHRVASLIDSMHGMGSIAFRDDVDIAMYLTVLSMRAHVTHMKEEHHK